MQRQPRVMAVLCAILGCAILLGLVGLMAGLPGLRAFYAESSRGAARSGILAYSQRTTLGNKLVRSGEKKLWFQRGLFRLETRGPDGEKILIGGPAGVFRVTDGGSRAVRLPDQDSRKSLIPGLSRLVSQADIEFMAAMRQRRKIGTETIAGLPAEIYEITIEEIAPRRRKGVERVWLGLQLPLPVKVVEKFADGESTVLALESAQFDVLIEDRLFQLPGNARPARAFSLL